MSNQGGPLVSVVTPFHNTARYLDECILSVLRQSHANFEYVLVDNASTDGSSQIAAKYAQLDDRIRLVRTPRLLPQVENYNFALAQISPESAYTKLVQADDSIFPTCIAEMVAVADRHPRAGIVSSYCVEGSSLRGVGLPFPTEIFSGRDICRVHLLDGLWVCGSPTTVMFRSDVVRARSPFYSLDRLHEDTEACYEILEKWDLAFVHSILSQLRVDSESITGKVTNYNPGMIDKLILIKRFGRTFLTESEYADVYSRVRGLHVDLLGEAVLRGRGQGFFEYHKRGLATIGERLTWFALALFALRALIRIGGTPITTLRRLLGRGRSRVMRTS